MNAISDEDLAQHDRDLRRLDELERAIKIAADAGDRLAQLALTVDRDPIQGLTLLLLERAEARPRPMGWHDRSRQL